MRRVSFLGPAGASWGVVEGDDDEVVIDLGQGHPGLGLSRLVDSLTVAPERIREAAAERRTVLRLSDLALLPVVPEPRRILCIGLNFEAHRLETGRERTTHPAVFTRFPDSLVGHGSPLIRPRESDHLDYEGELAVVVGRGGRRIPREAAWEHLAGATCFNDGSVRDYQAHTHQFTPGKNFPASGAMGPWLVDLGDLGDLAALELRTRLDGEVVQEARLDDLTFSVPELVEYCSTWTQLEPGDVIATGTPGGIGARATPPRWMGPGDVCEVEITGIGVLRNAVTDDTVAAPT